MRRTSQSSLHLARVPFAPARIAHRGAPEVGANAGASVLSVLGNETMGRLMDQQAVDPVAVLARPFPHSRVRAGGSDNPPQQDASRSPDDEEASRSPETSPYQRTLASPFPIIQREADDQDDDDDSDVDPEKPLHEVLHARFTQPKGLKHALAKANQGRKAHPARPHRDGFVANEAIAARIQAARGGGQRLDGATQKFMETRFGTDLSHVRLHAGTEAAGLSKKLHAHAFAVGRDIFFAEGRLNPTSAEGKRLLAHELTHVVQQTGLQQTGHTRKPLPFPAGKAGMAALAHAKRARAGVLAQAGKAHAAIPARIPAHRKRLHMLKGLGGLHPSPIHRWAGGPRVQRSLWGDAWNAVKKTAKKVVKKVGDVAGGVIKAVADIGKQVLALIAGSLHTIPGYTQFSALMGKDPISGKPVEGGASAIVQPLLALVPGGSKLAENLGSTGAISSAFTWLKNEWKKQGITLAYVMGLVGNLIKGFSPADLLAPKKALDKVINTFSPLLKKLKDFAVSVGKKALEFIFEAALKMAGPAGPKLLAIFRKTKDAFSKIIKDPIGFAKNLIASVKGGFQQFSSNAASHLKNGLGGWLLGATGGAMAGAGLLLPKKLDLPGVLSLALQILGLSWQAVRQRIVKIFGEDKVKQLESTVDIVKKLATGKLDALKEEVVTRVEDVAGTFIDGVREWAQSKIVVAAVTKLATMFNPAGAIIQAVIATVNTVQFFIERSSQIGDLVNSVLDSISTVADGKVSAAATFIEQSMGKAIPVILGFLSRLVGVGDVAGAVKKVLDKIRKPVGVALDKVAEFIKEKGQALWKMVTGNKDGDKGETKGESPEHDRLVGIGVEALKNESQKRQVDGKIAEKDAREVAKKILNEHSIFKSIEVVSANDEWVFQPVASEVDPVVAGKKEMSQSTNAVAKLRLFVDIEAKALGLKELKSGRVGHTWISLQYPNARDVPSNMVQEHRSLLEARRDQFADPMGFWPDIWNGHGYSTNVIDSYVDGKVLHPDRQHEGRADADESWDINQSQVDEVIKYAKSKQDAKYSVYYYNCTTFAKEAILSAKLTPPSMSKFGICFPNAVYDGIKANQAVRKWTDDKGKELRSKAANRTRPAPRI